MARILHIIILTLILLPLLQATVAQETVTEAQSQSTSTMTLYTLMLAPRMEPIQQDAVLRVLIPLKKGVFNGCRFRLSSPYGEVPSFLIHCMDGDYEIRLYPQAVWSTESSPGAGWNTDIDHPGFSNRGLMNSPARHFYNYIANTFGIGRNQSGPNTVSLRLIVNIPVPVTATIEQRFFGTITELWVNGVQYDTQRSYTTVGGIGFRSVSVNLKEGLNLIAFRITPHFDGTNYYHKADTLIKFRYPGYWIAEAFIRVPVHVPVGSTYPIFIYPATSFSFSPQVFKYWYDRFFRWDSSRYTLGGSPEFFTISISNGLLAISPTQGGYTITISANLQWPSDAYQVVGLYATGRYRIGLGNVIQIDSTNTLAAADGNFTHSLGGNVYVTHVVIEGWTWAVMTLSTDASSGQASIHVHAGGHARTKLFYVWRVGAVTSQAPISFYAETSDTVLYIVFYGIGVRPPHDYRGWQHFYREIVVERAALKETGAQALRVVFNATIYGGDIYTLNGIISSGLLQYTNASPGSTVFDHRAVYTLQFSYNSGFTVLLGVLSNIFTSLEILEYNSSTLTLRDGNTTIISITPPSSGVIQFIVSGSTRRMIIYTGTSINVYEASVSSIRYFNSTVSFNVKGMHVMTAPYPTFRASGLIAVDINGVDGLGRSISVLTFDGKYETKQYDIDPTADQVVFAYPFVYPVVARVSLYIEPQALPFMLLVPAIQYVPVTFQYTYTGSDWLRDSLIDSLRRLPVPNDYKTLIAVSTLLLLTLTVPVLPAPVVLVLSTILLLAFISSGWLSMPASLLPVIPLIILLAILSYRTIRSS